MKFQYKIFCHFIILVLSLLQITGCSLNKKVENNAQKSLNRAPYDVIIVPGYPYKAESNPQLFNIRVHWAKALYDRGIAKNIIFSGDAVHSPYIEGKSMGIFAAALGVPKAHIFEENKALHTNENIVKGEALAKKLGFTNFAFATDPYQFSYMTYMVKFYTPGKRIITFPVDSMAFYNQPLPKVDLSDAKVKNWSDKTE